MSDSSVEESYNKFVQFLYQYVTDPIKDFAKIKPRILSILQTHRPIKVIDYQWGISKAGRNKCHLIVHEFAERSKVREYFKTGKNIWYCCECTRTSIVSADQSVGDLLFENGMVFVKLEHECSPRQLSFVMNVQKLYKDKKMEEANALQKSVLGSEDVIALTKSPTSRKRSSKAAISGETSLQNSNNGAANDSESQPTNESVDEEPEILSPEDAFAKLIANLEEFTKEKAEVVLSNKSKLLSVLKTHRPIKMQDYHYGMSLNLRSNRSMIVFEWKDRKRVRIYIKTSDKYSWRCNECFRVCQRKTKVPHCFLFLFNGIVFVHVNHLSLCHARDYELVMQYQKFLEEGDTTKAHSMVQLVNFTYGAESLANYKNSLDLGNAPSLKDAKNYNAETSQKKNPIPPAASTFTFEKPSISMLEQICTKLKIEYSNRAIKLWDKIIFEQIDSDAIDIDKIETRKFKTENIYEILSRFFTGSSKQGEQIHATIFEAFRNKMVSSGEISAKEFDKQYSINDTVVTDRLLSFMAKFIPCRILIVEEKEIRMYGKWRSPGLRKRVTLVLSYFNGFYSVVLNL